MIYILESNGVIDEKERGFAYPVELILKNIEEEFTTLSLMSDSDEISSMLNMIVGNKDLVIISGGFIDLKSNEEWYLQSRRIIKKLVSNSNPLIGICFGAQMIYESLFPKSLILGEVPEIGVVKFNEVLPEILTKNNYFSVHSDGVIYNNEYDDQFDSLVTNKVGKYEIVQFFKLKDKLIYGTQFHPELNKDLFDKLTRKNGFKPNLCNDEVDHKEIHFQDISFFRNIINLYKLEGNYEKKK